MSSAFLISLLAVTLGACSDAGTGPDPLPGPEEDQFSVLLIGNSLTYANRLPELLYYLLGDLQEAEVYVEAVAYPNFGLPDHWVTGSARTRIAAGGWDVVILQQGPSATEGRPYLLEYAPRFAQEIRAVGAQPALYMVWPAQSRLFDFDGVSDSYATAAQMVDGFLLPAGEGWRAAWARDASIEFYDFDQFHPSLLGSYMAALVMAQQLTGGDLSTLAPVIEFNGGTEDLEQELADLLHAAAHEANRTFGRTPSSVN